MGLTARSQHLRIPEDCEADAPLAETCLDYTAGPVDNHVQPPTRNYKGVGPSAPIASVSLAVPAPGTFTIKGEEEDMIGTVEEARVGSIPVAIQRVTLENDKVISGFHYRYNLFDVQDYVNPPTAQGINATDNPLERTVGGQWEGPSIGWLPAPQSQPIPILTDVGYHFEAPEGAVDGSNVTFLLSPPPATGTSVIVILNGTILTEGVEYTLTDDTITFAVAPACGDVLLVYWQDDRATVAGTEVVCCSVEGADVIVVFAELGGVGCVSEGDRTALVAQYRLVKRLDTPLFIAAVRLPQILNPVDCLVYKGRLVIAAKFSIWTTCFPENIQNLTTLGKATIRSGLGTGIKALAQADTKDGHRFYALFGNSGVLSAVNPTLWAPSLPDGAIEEADEQLVIGASGNIVVTGGRTNTMQVNTNAGRAGGWAYRRGGRNALYEIIEVAVGQWDLIDKNRVLIYTLATDGVNATLDVSTDNGETWRFVHTFGSTPQYHSQLIDVVDAHWLYYQTDDDTFRNVNKGKDCEWEDISAEAVTYPIPHLCLDPNYPTRLVLVSPQFLLHDTFSGTNGSDLQSVHLPFYVKSGDAWTVENGTIQIQDNRAEAQALNSRATQDALKSDILIQAQFIPAVGSDDTGVIVRFADNSNYIMCILDELNDNLEIIEVVGGVPTVRATQALTVDGGSIYYLKVVAFGPVISVTVNSVDTITWANAPTASLPTKHGFTLDTGDSVDNFFMV